MKKTKDVPYSILVAASLMLLMGITTVSVLAQAPQPCPSRPGIYALKGGSWVELQTARAKKEKIRAAFPFHNSATAVYAGASSLTQLGKDVDICASGIPVGTSFMLAKAKESKKDRQVTVGTISPFMSELTFDIEKKQAIQIVQKRETDGSLSIHASALITGQYLLFMPQGSSLSSTPPAFDFFIL